MFDVRYCIRPSAAMKSKHIRPLWNSSKLLGGIGASVTAIVPSSIWHVYEQMRIRVKVRQVVQTQITRGSSRMSRIPNRIHLRSACDVQIDPVNLQHGKSPVAQLFQSLFA